MCMSVCMSVYMCVGLSVYMSVCMSVCTSVCMCVNLSVYVCVYVCLCQTHYVQLNAHVLSTPVIDDFNSDGVTEELLLPVNYYLDDVDDDTDR